MSSSITGNFTGSLVSETESVNFFDTQVLQNRCMGALFDTPPSSLVTFTRGSVIGNIAGRLGNVAFVDAEVRDNSYAANDGKMTVSCSAGEA